jgi:hypothetical protein
LEGRKWLAGVPTAATGVPLHIYRSNGALLHLEQTQKIDCD